MVWTRFKSLNPIDSYKGLTDVLTCQKNSKKWLEDSGDICLQAYIKQNKCSEYPNKAKGFWKNKEIKDSNELKEFIQKYGK